MGDPSEAGGEEAAGVPAEVVDDTSRSACLLFASVDSRRREGSDASFISAEFSGVEDQVTLQLVM